MHPDQSSHRRIGAPLAWRLADDSPAADVAAACGAFWLELDSALSPIIGPRGVAALGQRSLHLASGRYGWLAAAPNSAPATLDAAMLVALLGSRPSLDAAAAANFFLQTFRDLLASLIGAALTEQLLRKVWGPSDPPMNSPTAQDPTP